MLRGHIWRRQPKTKDAQVGWPALIIGQLGLVCPWGSSELLGKVVGRGPVSIGAEIEDRRHGRKADLLMEGDLAVI
jgi:hypothetical protein